jgi:hypothetical protein
VIPHPRQYLGDGVTTIFQSSENNRRFCQGCALHDENLKFTPKKPSNWARISSFILKNRSLEAAFKQADQIEPFGEILKAKLASQIGD